MCGHVTTACMDQTYRLAFTFPPAGQGAAHNVSCTARARVVGRREGEI